MSNTPNDPREDERKEESAHVEAEVSVSRPAEATEAPAPTEEALEPETAATEPEAAPKPEAEEDERDT